MTDLKRRVVLQMQISIDGFVEAASGERWQVWDWSADRAWDPALQRHFNEGYARADSVLLSRPMAQGGFIDHWRRVAIARADDPDFAFARRVGEIEKVILTSHPFSPMWERTRVIDGDRRAAVEALKSRPGGDILVFGGVRFARSLLDFDLVDELQLFVNPTAVGAGESLFSGTPTRPMRLLGSKGYDCGIGVNRYAPARA